MTPNFHFDSVRKRELSEISDFKSPNEQGICIFPFSIMDYQNPIFNWQFYVKADVQIGFSADSG